jgi:hypothetical protein
VLCELPCLKTSLSQSLYRPRSQHQFTLSTRSAQFTASLPTPQLRSLVPRAKCDRITPRSLCTLGSLTLDATEVLVHSLTGSTPRLDRLLCADYRSLVSQAGQRSILLSTHKAPTPRRFVTKQWNRVKGRRCRRGMRVCTGIIQASTIGYCFTSAPRETMSRVGHEAAPEHSSYYKALYCLLRACVERETHDRS